MKKTGYRLERTLHNVPSALLGTRLCVWSVPVGRVAFVSALC